MKISIRISLTYLIITFLSNMLYAQKNLKKDTVYYLVDTTRIPLKDRMFDIGIEDHFYYYRLTCQCYPWQTDPVFTYVLERKGSLLTNNEQKKLNLISLRGLINIVVEYGLNRKDKKVFYFIEPKDQSFIMHRVYLMDPRKPTIAINIESVKGIDSSKIKRP
jgi:hypothetical protein